MLRINENPKKKPAKKVTFESPSLNQKKGIDMLITLNLTPKQALTGPEVDDHLKILVIKEKPNFMYNPKICSEELNDDGDVCIMNIIYQNYLGEEQTITISEDIGGEIKQAINHLNNGIPRKKRNANKPRN